MSSGRITNRAAVEAFAAASQEADEQTGAFSPDGFDPWSATALVREVAAECTRNPAPEPTSWMGMSEEERARIRSRRRGHLRLVIGGGAGSGSSSGAGEAA